MNRRISQLLIMVVAGIFFLTPYFLFFWHFGKYEKSDQSNDWGNFGDFVGGVSGSLMALGNLIAFIYLTMKIETLNTSRHEEQIKIQNNQIEIQRKITKCNLQSEFIKDVNKIFIPVEQDLEKLYAESFLDKIQVQLIFTVNNGTAWFNSLEENKNLDNLIDKLEEIRTEINKRKPNEDALVKLTFQLIEFKMTFIDSLKKEMMDELNQ